MSAYVGTNGDRAQRKPHFAREGGVLLELRVNIKVVVKLDDW